MQRQLRASDRIQGQCWCYRAAPDAHAFRSGRPHASAIFLIWNCLSTFVPHISCMYVNTGRRSRPSSATKRQLTYDRPASTRSERAHQNAPRLGITLGTDRSNRCLCIFTINSGRRSRWAMLDGAVSPAARPSGRPKSVWGFGEEGRDVPSFFESSGMTSDLTPRAASKLSGYQFKGVLGGRPNDRLIGQEGYALRCGNPPGRWWLMYFVWGCSGGSPRVPAIVARRKGDNAIALAVRSHAEPPSNQALTVHLRQADTPGKTKGNAAE